MKEILRLIPQEYRKRGFTVAALVLLRAILDLVGVASLIPVIMLVLDPVGLRNSFVGNFVLNLGICGTDVLNTRGFSLFIILMVIAILLLKIILSILITIVQNRFMMSLYRNLSSRLFISLYSRGLLYIKNQNSAKMTFNVTGVCHNFVMGHLGSMLSLAGELSFVLLLFVGLLIYSPYVTLVAMLAFLPGLLIYILVVRKPLRKINKMENETRREQSRLINEAFRGYSEVQVNDAFPVIQSRFSRGLENISSFRIRSILIQSIPSYMLELSVVVIVAVLTLMSLGSTSQTVFLGVCAVALLKLLPAVRSILGAISAISATMYTREVIADINAPAAFPVMHQTDCQPLGFEDAIRVKDVSFCFDGDETPVIDHLNFTIPKGSRFGIRGRTGAGKTTLFNLLLGLYPPTQGQVMVDDQVLGSNNASSWHRIVGYVPQEVFIADSTIVENVALGESKDMIDRQKVAQVLERASLLDFVNTLPSGMDTRIGEAGCRLSGGQKQRLGIARALYKDAKVLFFDEATSSLDSQTELEVNEAVRTLSDTRNELTIIIISHRDSTLSFCSEILDI